jgi:ABC-type lipoprotein export system ATPase subunit
MGASYSHTATGGRVDFAPRPAVIGFGMVNDDLVIRLRDVRKSYGAGPGRTHVLRGVSFDVTRGELLALVGQSGSGKSTLLNIIGGLDHADSGQVEVLGHDYATTPEHRLARLRNADIGFVFQSFNLLDHLTCLGNVTLPAMFSRDHGLDEARGLEALRRVGMSDLARRKPPELSGGQKQRVAIARALFCRPRLLLCDEPTGNLDTRTGQEVIEFFRELNRRDGVTLIIVTHERRVSSAATRILSMRDGLLVEGDGADMDGDGANMDGAPGLTAGAAEDSASRIAGGHP